MRSNNETLKKENDIPNKKYLQISIKRIMDIILSSILIVLLLPLEIIIAISIKIDSKGPIIFRQERVGKDGNIFVIFKYRTMVNNADKLYNKEIDKESIDNFVFQDKDDPRVTKVGKFLRKTSLDELPQLFNVLIGNMSLIGPRPEIKDIADLYDDNQRRRLCMKPGISGLAQVNGRGNLELGETIKYDLKYIDEFNISLDIYIMFKTIAVVFKREGAY